MVLTEHLQSTSPNKLLFALLGWTVVMTGITRVYNPLALRVVAGLGTGLLLVWWVWAVYQTLPRRKHPRINRKT